jgi:hypothetical protein
LEWLKPQKNAAENMHRCNQATIKGIFRLLFFDHRRKKTNRSLHQAGRKNCTPFSTKKPLEN